MIFVVRLAWRPGDVEGPHRRSRSDSRLYLLSLIHPNPILLHCNIGLVCGGLHLVGRDGSLIRGSSSLSGVGVRASPLRSVAAAPFWSPLRLWHCWRHRERLHIELTTLRRKSASFNDADGPIVFGKLTQRSGDGYTYESSITKRK